MKRKTPTVREIAKVSGVSVSTVSRALNGSVPVNPTTRAKVMSALQTLEQANIQSTETSNYTIGIIIPQNPAGNLSGHPSLLTIITNFVEYLTEHGVSNTTLIYDESSINTDLLFKDKLDGYLIIGTSEKQENFILQELSSRQIPSILINRYTNFPYTGSISFEELNISVEAVDYLIQLGHQNIVFVGGNNDFQNTKRRLSGYRQALSGADLPIREDYIFLGEYSEFYGYEIGAKLLSLTPRPTAGFFASDTLAIGCMRYMLKHGIRLPEDFAVIGFGNIAACEQISPSLTTISQPDTELGTIAAITLLQMIKMPIISAQQISLKTSLVIRESSGAPLANDIPVKKI